ncbi:MAG: sugar kinase [Lachnospira sp.]|nr:sugar kinase [Lachnospira sp.]MDD5828694.1 sugar kinase [Lachnospira sp.]
MKDKIITFGEIMLRLSPENNERFTQCHEFEAVYGGGEANTAVSLANFGVDVNYVTKLPNHTIGQAAVNALRQYGVGIDDIVRGGDQIGIYFLEKKTSQRPSNVIYNRSGSAIALATEDDFDWDKIFGDATWFHFSGITPAISDSMANITLIACKKAKEKGLTISCDLNYRSKLWSSEKANAVMSEICKYVDICIANEDDAVGIFSMDASNTTEEKNAYIAKELMKMFPFKMVASVWRTETSITTFKLQSMVYTNGKAYYSKEYFMHILDYIGAGDAYCAGIIYSLINNYDAQKTVEFSNAASCLKHTVSGDFNLVTVDEVNRLAFSESGNEVQR